MPLRLVLVLYDFMLPVFAQLYRYDINYNTPYYLKKKKIKNVTVVNRLS